MLKAPAMPIRSLYAHVPFCARKCLYCAFFSEPASTEVMDRYVAALVRELELVGAELRPETVFFGGGTPSLLKEKQWRRILETMDRLGLLGAAEWTVECNPGTVSLDQARLLREYGVNRISLGVQSLEPDILARLGRIHSRETVFKSFDLLRKAGFDNVNLDLMFAIPGQTLEQWKRTLAEAVAMGGEHLASYELTYEEDTPFFEQFNAGKLVANEDLACDMYEMLVETAASSGFQQYEVSNFARDKRTAGSSQPSPQPSTTPVPAYACRHNVNYWRGGSFFGLGPSATGYVGGVRTKNFSNTQKYCEALELGKRAIDYREELAPLARAGETAAFGLRMVAGWPFALFQEITGHDLRASWSRELSQLSECGWGETTGETFRLTRQGLRFADAAAELFVGPETLRVG
jgi:oxygen-independent coproporphyrinogen III oxidase